MLLKQKNLIIDKINVPGYEMVLKITEPTIKLTAFIAIHNTNLGNALGGVRILPYADPSLALDDVLNLAKAMSYKSAIANVDYGGGKSVIIADYKDEKLKASLLPVFAEVVESLKGKYIAAKDMGCTFADLDIINKTTSYVVGRKDINSSGDPGLFTARGIYRCMQATMNIINKNKDLKNTKIVVQGLGNVGWSLLNYLFWADADIYVSDIDEEKMRMAKKLYGVKIIDPKKDNIMEMECDIFSPCAFGNIITEESCFKFNCKSIVGAANNQLCNDKCADILKERNIIYAPDFVVNAGGLINVALEFSENGYDAIKSREKTNFLYNTLISIYEMSEKNATSMHEAAVTLAKNRIEGK